MPFDGLQMPPICTELGVGNVIKEERKKLLQCTILLGLIAWTEESLR